MKMMMILPALAMMCLVSSVQADNGAIDSATLSAMGLSNVQVMTDAEAQDVRGMGYSVRPRRSLALAFGVSYATIGGGSHGGGGSAGTVDGFLAFGNHVAKGDHSSIASIETVKTETKTILGVPAYSITKTHKLTIGAGGSSSSFAF